MGVLQSCVQDYRDNVSLFQTIDRYYRGKTDAMAKYQMITDRTNNRTNTNFIKKFVKEEVAYILGNPITYISRNGDKIIINAITQALAHWSEKHDKNLLKNALKYGEAYELYYTNSEGFCSRILSPLNAYVKIDDYGNVEMLLHFFTKQFDDAEYLDVYDSNCITHYKTDNLEEPIGIDEHFFGNVPVGVCRLSEEGSDDTLFTDLKGLQDAYETNLSDITNEISDFRNAYLKLVGADMDDKDFQKLKQLGGLKVPKDGDIDWLIKNINDSFIQNTLKTLKENMYEISNHINSNEKLQSNTSSLALRTRLIALEQKCKDNADAVTDCIKTRMKFLFVYLYKISSIQYDYRNIKLKYTVAIPQDDLMMAQIASQVPEGTFSRKTTRAQFSFCDNPDEEEKRVKAEDETIDLDEVDEADE